jgi:hypothetical protein
LVREDDEGCDGDEDSAALRKYGIKTNDDDDIDLRFY